MDEKPKCAGMVRPSWLREPVQCAVSCDRPHHFLITETSKIGVSCRVAYQSPSAECLKAAEDAPVQISVRLAV